MSRSEEAIEKVEQKWAKNPFVGLWMISEDAVEQKDCVKCRGCEKMEDAKEVEAVLSHGGEGG